MKTDINLFVALVSLYSLEEYCFLLRGRKIVPTLDDIERIMGLSINGKPVTGTDFKKAHLRALFEELLGGVNFVCRWSESQIKMQHFLDVMVVPQDAVGQVCIYHEFCLRTVLYGKVGIYLFVYFC